MAGVLLGCMARHSRPVQGPSGAEREIDLQRRHGMPVAPTAQILKFKIESPFVSGFLQQLAHLKKVASLRERGVQESKRGKGRL